MIFGTELESFSVKSTFSFESFRAGNRMVSVQLMVSKNQVIMSLIAKATLVITKKVSIVYIILFLQTHANNKKAYNVIFFLPSAVYRWSYGSVMWEVFTIGM